MAQESNSLLGRIAGLFSGKVDVEKLKRELKTQSRDIEKQMLGVEFDMRAKEAQRDEAIRRGVEAARQGRTVEKQKCAMRIQIVNTHLEQMRQGYAMMAKTQCVAELAKMQLEMATPGGALDAVKRLQILLAGKELGGILTDTQLDYETFQREAAKLFHSVTGQIEAGDVVTLTTDNPYVNLLDELAQAEVKGDADGAKMVREKMLRPAKEQSGFDSLLDL
ncbi:MAG: hypothetical protein KBE65_20715 [Phycisphaerae bacterium]|nr:hypothetical protein [Phycisphaerae bacterium]